MPIPFTCPHCGLRTEVLEEYAGQSGPCAECGRTVTVPPLAEAPNYAPPRKRSAAPIVVLVVVVVLLLLMFAACLGVFVVRTDVAMPSGREAARRAACQNNLRQIGLAMHSYHDDYGCFPSAYVADEKGRPVHSWRVLLLPYLGAGAQAIHEEYDVQQPWDSPHNLALRGRMPPVYRCPSDESAAVSQTSYAMVVGPEAISDGPGTTRADQITAPAYETILVVESAGCGIEWTEPRDLEADQIRFLVDDPVDGGIQSGHLDGANALLCDGSVLFLSSALDPDEVQAMCSTPGWESVEPQAAEADDSQPADSDDSQADGSDEPQAAETDEPEAEASDGASSVDSKDSPDA